MLAPLSLISLLLVGGGAEPSIPAARLIPPGEQVVVALPDLDAGATSSIVADLPGLVHPRNRVELTLVLPGGHTTRKVLHAGDPGAVISVRPPVAGVASLTLRANPANIGSVAMRVSSTRRDVAPEDHAAIEAEPNDSWREANPLTLGRAVFGIADDVEDLDNPAEGHSGVDWFRVEVPAGPPVLASVFLELLDRDVSANLRVHRLDPSGQGISLHTQGKDPTEVVHDRERERYSTHLTRVLEPGTYFVEVIANHPDYILRTRIDPVPPLANDPERAVDIGLQYLLEAGDAWFAQTPRAGHRYTRAANLHDTAVRCTACHASTFPVEASLVGQEAGYPIRAKQSLLDLTDRLANGPTPLYGGEGLFWQRYIAIPLQAQGKQGGVLLDYARQVDGRDAAAVDRFGRFLRAAWRGRWELPPDESNGVIPLDSAFGSAWRDWRVLDELTRRTRQVAYAGAADAIADLFADPSLDARVQNLQDRMHRLHAWTVIDPAQFAPRIRAEADALLALQGPDGGWHELGTPGQPSAVYPTGQMLWTLMTAGVPRDDPRIQRGLAFLLARQEAFGGWFETTTHENFRTPMRETRYALEALALGYPRAGHPRTSWGNRDDGPPRLPRSGPLAATLADLDDLWDVPEEDRTRFAAAIVPLLSHADPTARATAAACLGRLGDPSAAEPLAQALGDPAKAVSRASAWSLRRLANRGLGLDALRSALISSDPATRRGAVRVFNQQFWGLDGRLDFAGLLIDRASDPDLGTRLGALRSLRQWFYRTESADLRRRIVSCYLDRMAVDDEPVVRRALSEGMYIMLDENLGGGVSLQRTLAILPERSRSRALRGRIEVERTILLGPIFEALEAGNSLQREALIRSFDGSFLPGRLYARQPTGMIDVGNDREFGFLYEPPADLVDRVFAALRAAPDLSPNARVGSTRLATFFGASGQPTKRAEHITIPPEVPPPVSPQATIIAAPKRDRPHLPSLATFRTRINPLLTQPGEDGASCASCHANQNHFRVLIPGSEVTPEEALATNYRSSLEAVDWLDPEASPLVRKPQARTDSGAGDGVDPTLTHGGGARWDHPDHPALGAIRAWLAEATPSPAPTATVNGAWAGLDPSRIVDGDFATAWPAPNAGDAPSGPLAITVDLGVIRRVDGLMIVPDRASPGNPVRRYEVSLSSDAVAWGSPVAQGTWAPGPGWRAVALPGTSARFVRLRVLDRHDSGSPFRLAEILVDASPLPPDSP